MRFEGLQTLISAVIVLATACIGGCISMVVTLIIWWFWPITPEFPIVMTIAGGLSGTALSAFLIWRKT